MTDKVVVLVNCSSLEEAERVGRQLVAKRLAACVNLVPGVRSWYWWEDKVGEDNEVMVMIKTSRERLAELEKEVVRLHSYAVPEVIALQVVDGSRNYLNWIESSLSGKP
ncbi:MAG: divalent-cation tolerance protein CutA [Acidobacteria bacterium]|nr:divalent-cation tolerance protein CutA [Acidobacteriota bacterium]